MHPRNLGWATSITRVLAFRLIIKLALIGTRRLPQAVTQEGRSRSRPVISPGRADRPIKKRPRRLFVQAAEQGEVRGLYQAALMHLSGDGLPENIDKAETYLRNAAKHDYLPAVISLAELYTRGKGIEPDLREAANWYERAAELGDVESQFIIGRLFATGAGVPTNLRESAKWFLRAAEQGHATAAHNIAAYYAKGTGVERDQAKAIEWYKKAADRGITASQVQLGKMLYSVAMTARAIEISRPICFRKRRRLATAKQRWRSPCCICKARAWRAIRPRQELAEAGRRWRPCWRGPSARPCFFRQVREWQRGQQGRGHQVVYERRRGRGCRGAIYLGMLYLKGDGVSADPAAADWIEKAAHSDHAASQFQLGVMYCTGQGVPQDLPKAIAWYELAAQLGYPLAQYNLAVMLAKGQGCKVSLEKAFSWFGKSAEQGSPKRNSLLVMRTILAVVPPKMRKRHVIGMKKQRARAAPRQQNASNNLAEADQHKSSIASDRQRHLIHRPCRGSILLKSPRDV